MNNISELFVSSNQPLYVYKELRKIEEEEKSKEEALERKIRELRKVNSRTRREMRPLRNQPYRKRRKVAA